MLQKQASDERDGLLPGIAGDEEGTAGGLLKPLAEGALVGRNGRLEDSGSHRRLARLGPAVPEAVKRPEAPRRNAQLASEPDARSNRVLQPLLEIARVECPHRPPVASDLLAADPRVPFPASCAALRT